MNTKRGRNFTKMPPPPKPVEQEKKRQRGTYQPWAQQMMQQVRYNPTGADNPHVQATYDPGLNQINFRPPIQPPVLKHEMGHMFDFKRGLGGRSEYWGEPATNRFGWTSPQNYRAQYPNTPHGADVMRENPFLAYAMGERPDPTFPGMYGNPQMEYGDPGGDLWGGHSELYARMNERPQDIPQGMRQFFPQFDMPFQPQGPGKPGQEEWQRWFQRTDMNEINRRYNKDEWANPRDYPEGMAKGRPKQDRSYDQKRFLNNNPGMQEKAKPWMDQKRYMRNHPDTLEKDQEQPPTPAPPGFHWEYVDDGDEQYWRLLKTK